MKYAALREQLYGPIREEGIFTWDYMHGQEYALASIHYVQASFMEEMAEAAERLGLIYRRAVEVVRQAPDELLLELGVPRQAMRAVRLVIPGGDPTVIGRFDFACTDQGIKMLEFNSDTPTGIVEAFYVNEKVCEFFGALNPNAGKQRQIGDAFGQIRKAYAGEGYPVDRVYFSALGWHEEDAATARYLLSQSGLSGSFVPLEDLRVYEDRLQVWSGDRHLPVDLLYRLHPIEKLVEDRDSDGFPTGGHVLDLAMNRKVALVNPPGAFLAQTKALQALIWSLYEAGEFFQEEERATISRYMLPTYLENRFAGKCAYAAKPILGREGGAVTLYNADGSAIAKDADAFYWDQPMVYQQMAELPKLNVETITGPYEGNLLWGCFLMGGHASAVVARVGEKITGNLSCYLPVAVQ